MKDAFNNVENKQAILIIEEFFEWHGLDYALMDMENMIYYAMHRKYYKTRSPYTLVFFAETLRKLFPACLVLEKDYCLKKAFKVDPNENDLPDMGRREDFMPNHPLLEWYYLPRHLSMAQYLNPMKAFTQFRKYKTSEEWMHCIDELLEYALSQSTINECNPPYNMMKMRRLLLQLIEGCYLVFIRYRRCRDSEGDVAAPADAIDNGNE